MPAIGLLSIGLFVPSPMTPSQFNATHGGATTGVDLALDNAAESAACGLIGGALCLLAWRLRRRRD